MITLNNLSRELDGLRHEIEVLKRQKADLLAACERLAAPHECGCKPCTHQCTSQDSLQIIVDEMREIAREAIAHARGEQVTT